MDDENGGLFNIEISDDAESASDAAEKVPRDFQSEADFHQQRSEWRVKIEKGEIWKTLKLPIDHPTKPQSQTILHAIEELYFFRRYVEACKVASDVLKGELNGEFRSVVEGYRAKCEARVKTAGN